MKWRCLWLPVLTGLISAGFALPALAQVDSTEGNALILQVGGTERARISDTAGNLGIGTTNPVAKLTVNGNVSVTGMIDVGHTAQACATAISGSIRYETTSDTIQVCTASGWKSLTSATTVGNATVASSTGAVQFNSGGQLAGDTANLFWDDANERLGVGTALPSGTVHIGTGSDIEYNRATGYLVVGTMNSAVSIDNNEIMARGLSTTSPLYLQNDGGDLLIGAAASYISSSRVGIGVQYPQATLQVSGSMVVSTTASTTLVVTTDGLVGIGDTPGSVLHVSGTGQLRLGGRLPRLTLEPAAYGNSNLWNLDNSNGFFRVYTEPYSAAGIPGGGTVRMVIASSTGYVGINDTSPLARLDVNGTISATDAVQIGASSMTCTTPVSGSVRYNISSDTLQVCTSTGWKSLTSATTVGNATVASSTGAVQFNSGGQLAGDTANLFWDDASNRLGVGTGTPSMTMFISNSSNYGAASATVGIASKYSQLMLQDTDDGDFTHFSYSGNMFAIRNNSASMVPILGVWDQGGVTVGALPSSAAGPTATLQVSGSLLVSTTAQITTPSLYVGTDGKVGIGTATPTGYLNVTSGQVNIGAATTLAQGLGLTVQNNGLAFAQPTPSGSTEANRALVRYIYGSIAQDYGVIGNGITWVQNRLVSDFSLNYGYAINPNGGNVGIGTVTPTATLTVNGTISASDAVQVGTSSLTCSAGVPGAIRYNAGGLQYCNGTAWTTLSSGIAGGGATNHLAYWSDASTLSYDNGQLYWDATDNQLGVGTSNPQATLQVSGSFVVSTSAQAYTSPSFYVDTMGRTAIGTNAPSAMLTVVSYTAGLVSSQGAYIYMSQNPQTTPSAHYRGIYVINDYNSTVDAASGNSVRGGEFLGRSLGTGDISYTYGVLAYGQSQGGTSMYGNTGIYSFASVSNSTASTYLYGAQIYAYDYNGPGVGGVNSAYGAIINGYSNAGRMTNYYGLYLNSFSGVDPSGSFYGIYQADGAMDNYFAGTLGVGTPTPSGKLHVSGDAGASWVNSSLWFTNTGTGARSYSMGPRTDGNFYIGDETVGASRITLESGGDVGIGALNPNAKLEVNGTVSATALSGNGDAVTGVVHGVSVTVYGATAGTFFYAPPANTTYMEVIVHGAGGGGGGTDGQNCASCYAISGGGGAGGWAEKYINNPDTSYTIVVPSGGTGGAGVAGTAGGTAYFNGASLSVYATGGGAGSTDLQATSGSGASGASGTGVGGDINGGSKSVQLTRWISGASTSAWDGAYGMDSRFGPGGSYTSNGNGVAGSNCGSGGGGVYHTTQETTNRTGGAGAKGCVIIKAYY